MYSRLTVALRQKAAFLKAEEHLLERARVFYKMAFTPRNLTPSQMAAVGDLLRSSNSIKEAQYKIDKFLNKQIKKLKAKEERSGKPGSWQTPLRNEVSGTPLGEILKEWIRDQKYLEGCPGPDEIHRLSSMRRFWNYVYGQYCYEKALGKGMPLEEVDLS
jgi:hypothetical protein